MKTLFLALILTLCFGGFQSAQAQSEQQLKVRIGQQKTFSRSKLKIKFVSLVEDSRCAEGVQCIWAGNASIKVKVTDRKGVSEIIEMNTNTGRRGGALDGYAINLESLTPTPKANVRLNRNAYTATFLVRKITR